MYYLTVEHDGSEIIRRKQFGDYSDAVNYLSRYFKAITRRSVLSLTTEVINGVFARSYGSMNDPMTIDRSEQERYSRAVRYRNAFENEGSYFFLIESEAGIQDVHHFESDDDESDDE
jgi:hypothetical protein